MKNKLFKIIDNGDVEAVEQFVTSPLFRPFTDHHDVAATLNRAADLTDKQKAIKILTTLLNKGFKANTLDGIGYSPLEIALRAENAGAMALLIKHGADYKKLLESHAHLKELSVKSKTIFQFLNHADHLYEESKLSLTGDRSIKVVFSFLDSIFCQSGRVSIKTNNLNTQVKEELGSFERRINRTNEKIVAECIAIDRGKKILLGFDSITWLNNPGLLGHVNKIFIEGSEDTRKNLGKILDLFSKMYLPVDSKVTVDMLKNYLKDPEVKAELAEKRRSHSINQLDTRTRRALLGLMAKIEAVESRVTTDSSEATTKLDAVSAGLAELEEAVNKNAADLSHTVTSDTWAGISGAIPPVSAATSPS